MSGAALGTLAYAQTDDQKQKYKEWSAIIGVWGYDWEPVEVVTDDGYTLTLMHVTQKSGWFSGKPDPKLAPILVQPPMGSSPHSWLEVALGASAETPVILKLRDAGHDLWLTYSRGTDYSNKHKEYAYDSKQFWDFSWEDMGVGDIKAALSYVNANTEKKVVLLGYSMGTTQIFSAMALDYQNFYRDRTYKVVQLAPCTVTDPSMYKAFNLATVTALDTMNIFEVGGPTWWETVVKLRKII